MNKETSMTMMQQSSQTYSGMTDQFVGADLSVLHAAYTTKEKTHVNMSNMSSLLYMNKETSMTMMQQPSQTYSGMTDQFVGADLSVLHAAYTTKEKHTSICPICPLSCLNKIGCIL